MKIKSRAWQQLQDHASAQLSPNFADRVLQITHGSPEETASWSRLLAYGAAQLRPGFAARVLAAARARATPSLGSQFLVSAATAAVCLAAFFVLHEHVAQIESAQNLVGWNQIAAQAEDLGQFP